METLTKASRFTKGFGEEERQGALTKRFLVTKRPENRRGFGLGDAGVVGSESSAHGRTEWSGLVMTGRFVTSSCRLTSRLLLPAFNSVLC